MTALLDHAEALAFAAFAVFRRVAEYLIELAFEVEGD